MTASNLPSPELLRDLLDYDPDTGRLTWRTRSAAMLVKHGLSVPYNLTGWNSRHAGAQAFTADNGKGYRVSTVLKRMYRANRVAWAIHYGSWPTGMVASVNGDRADTRIANLMIVDAVECGRRSRRAKRNRSGQTGVYRSRSGQGWFARITVRRKKISLGEFSKFEDAVQARKDAEKLYGFSPLHGRAR